MYRRDVLGGGLLLAGLAGCLDDADPTDPGEDGPDDPDEGGADGEPTVAATDFEVRSVDCGTGENEATVSIGEAVDITGTIRGRNGCYSAGLDDAGIGDGTLTVAIESYDDSDGDELCTECLTDIAYEARIEIDGPDPEEIVVEHDGSAVASRTV